MNKRTALADLSKGIAVLLMIQVHIIELFATPQIFSSSTGSFLLFLGGPFVAPIFAVVFGYFIAKSKLTTTQTIIRGIKLFFVGLLLNLALNFNLLLSVYNGKFKVNVLEFIFGVDFLLFAGLAIIIIALLKKFLENKILVTIAMSLFFAFLGHILLQFQIENETLKYISAFIYGSSHWSYFPIFPWISYPILGMAIAQIKKKHNLEKIITKKIQIFLSVFGILFITLTIKYAITTSANLQEYYHHGVVFFSWIFAFIIFYGIFINKIDQFIGNTKVFKYIKWIGKNVTAMYFIQWIFIGNIGTEVYKSISNPYILIGSFMGILLLSSIICYSYLKLKKPLR
jgi:hypothetical protein